jgi:hypothetical protein
VAAKNIVLFDHLELDKILDWKNTKAIKWWIW